MDKVAFVEEKLKEIFEFLGIHPVATVQETPELLSVTIEGDNLNFLIGYRGEALDALQNILSQAFAKQAEEWVRIMVDINDYKEGRLQKVEDMTKNFIDRVRFSGEAVEMPPMKPFERFRVHTFVSEYSDIESESVGESYDRRVVLRPVSSNESS